MRNFLEDFIPLVAGGYLRGIFLDDLIPVFEVEMGVFIWGGIFGLGSPFASRFHP